ncbi:MAG: orotate phosphoribosyltransferase [Firmicutes bacterium]|nr:orotate phosphoribosyltransferase [Bacillota bacterium]
MTKAEVLAVFEKTGGILKGHFVLTSGRHADTYMQCAKLFIDPVESEKLCNSLAKNLKKYDAEYVVSPAVGGILFGYEMARALGLKNIFAEREDGKFNFRRGFDLKKGTKVLVVEDVVTTGGSAREVVALLQSIGCQVLAVASLVDRSGGKAEFGGIPFEALISLEIPSFEKENCPICPLGIPAIKPGSRNLA